MKNGKKKMDDYTQELKNDSQHSDSIPSLFELEIDIDNKFSSMIDGDNFFEE